MRPEQADDQSPQTIQISVKNFFAGKNPLVAVRLGIGLPLHKYKLPK